MARLTTVNLEPCDITKQDLIHLKKKALDIRETTLRMIYKAKSGHPGGSLSSIDLLVALYGRFLIYDPKNPTNPKRDFFILSKGHAAPALYSTLAHFHIVPEIRDEELRKLGSEFQGHPKKGTLPGIEVSTGALGMGLSIGVGLALCQKIDQVSNRVFVVLGDGECQEGSVWEAAMAASHYHLDNLIVLVDRNGLQIDGSTEKIMSLEPFGAKWESFGFNVIEIDGTNMQEILDALHTATLFRGKPTVIIAYLVKGHGTNFMEHVKHFHGNPPKTEEYEQALHYLAELRRKILDEEVGS